MQNPTDTPIDTTVSSNSKKSIRANTDRTYDLSSDQRGDEKFATDFTDEERFSVPRRDETSSPPVEAKDAPVTDYGLGSREETGVDKDAQEKAALYRKPDRST